MAVPMIAAAGAMTSAQPNWRQVRARVRRQVRDREREGAEPGPGVQPDKDQCADPGRQQAGQ